MTRPKREVTKKNTETIRKTATGIRIKPDKKFFRLDEPFNDAVRSGKKSAVTSVLLRADLSADNARRTAKKILPKSA